MPLIIWLFSFSCIFDRFCSSANHFSVTFNLFFKKYISFVLSQYKNKAHCTYCSIGKVVFFLSFLFKWLLLLFKRCRWVVSGRYPGFLLFYIMLVMRVCLDCVWRLRLALICFLLDHSRLDMARSTALVNVAYCLFPFQGLAKCSPPLCYLFSCMAWT